jgi:hypothetical protein
MSKTTIEHLKATAREVAEVVRDAILAEREACARVADPIEHSGPWTDVEKQAYDVRAVVAAAIRNRQQ